MVRITSSADEQAPFVIVHLSVALVPAAKFVTVDVAVPGFVMVAEPEATDHNPVPIVGTFPFSVKLLLLQFDWSVPALAVVGVA